MDSNNNGMLFQYEVKKASNEQIDEFIKTRYESLSGKRDVIIAYVVFGENDTIIAHIIIEEKTMPKPFEGVDWFIWNIYTHNDYRRQGIASILLNNIKKYAKQMNVSHLIGSCIDTSAHKFWNKHNFCFIMYGSKINNINKQNEHGNYPHMTFYRINKHKADITEINDYKVKKMNNKQLNIAFDEYIIKYGLKFFHEKKKDILGFASFDDKGDMIGFITIFKYELGAPLDGFQYIVPYIHINSSQRNNEIACSLINAIIKYAKKEDVKQLTYLYIDPKEAMFWYNINFDICVNYIAKNQEDKNPISIAYRI